MKKNSFFDFLIFVFFACVIFFTFRGLFYSFFQQDEWLTMGTTLSGGIFAELSHQSILDMLRPFGSIFNYAIYYYFPFRIDIIVWIALIIHTVNTFLWYKVVVNLTRERLIASISALFFSVAYVSSQAVTWFASIFTTLPAATFIFICILSYLKYRKKMRIKYIVYSQVAAFVAFMFKESAMFIIAFVPLMFYWENRKTISIRKMLTVFLPTLIFLSVMILTRVHWLFSLGDQGTSFVSQTSSLWQRIVFHSIFYPLLSSVQMFIPPTVMFSASRFFQTVNYGTINGFTETQLGVESIVSDFVSFIAFTVCSVVFSIIYYRSKPWRNILLFGFVYILFSFLPFIVINKGNAYLDSRYFYNGVAGGGLLLAVCIYILYRAIRKYKRNAAWLACTFLFIIFSAYVAKNIQLIRRDIRKDVLAAQERKQLLVALKTYNPVLPDKAVVYITGDNGGYYGLPELKIPFQQGPGYTIMTWYYDSGKIPKRLLMDAYLWRIKDEGYTEDNGQAFGYFWNKQALIQAIEANKIREEQIVGFFYDSNNKKLNNITDELRKELQPYF